ncbi:MAG: hypothetical protein EAZ08_00815 [Cytophagales bacterium]|nr:MAG: hypothetical protein EAZ08_00815 [Cytophagales bacterium]
MKKLTLLFAILSSFIFVKGVAYAQVVKITSVRNIQLKALYLNCGNELSVSVSNYDTEKLSFKAEGAELILGSRKGNVTLVPNAAKAMLSIFYNDTLVGTEAFPVRLLPKPEVALFVGNSTQPHDSKIAVSKADLDKIRCTAFADKSMTEAIPKDTQYRVSYAEVALARQKQMVTNVLKSTEEVIMLEDMMKLAEAGDRLIIEVKKVERLNYRGEWEIVSLPAIIYAIAIK